MQVPASCPHCDQTSIWELELSFEKELAFRAPHSPGFLFACPHCGGHVRIGFRWTLRKGADPRRLQLVGGAANAPQKPALLLVDDCPHGCELTLGLQLFADDPWANDRNWPDEDRTLGGYRCPRCDGEGVLEIRPFVEIV
jgi:hypothetical protein